MPPSERDIDGGYTADEIGGAKQTGMGLTPCRATADTAARVAICAYMDAGGKPDCTADIGAYGRHG